MVSDLSNNNSRIKKDKTNNLKSKLVFAKNKNEVIALIIVAVLFVGNMLYLVVKNYTDNHPHISKNQTKTAEQIAQDQKKNLQSLTDPSMQNNNADLSQDANDIYSQTVKMQDSSGDVNNAAQSEDNVDIIPKTKAGFKKHGKDVLVSVSESGRSNPFLPAAENTVASSSLPYLAPPPETLAKKTDASKIITTTISGILYDKYNPSAIINIEGNDYLVKRGDIINHYKILSITQTEVLVQLGRNIYKAGVGQLLSETNLNYNVIANLNKKFGGNDVQIHAKRKGY